MLHVKTYRRPFPAAVASRALRGSAAAELPGQLHLGQLAGDGVGLRLHALGLLGHKQLDVGGRRHVRVDATVGTVRPTAAALCLVDLNVGHVQVVHLQTLELGVGLGIPQQAKHELAALLGPAALANLVALILCLGGAAHAAVVVQEGHAALVLHDGLHVSLGLGQAHAAHSTGSLHCVLEVHAQVGPAGLRQWQS